MSNFEGVVGLRGQGKTLYSTYRALEFLKAGTGPVFASYRINGAHYVPDVLDLFIASLPPLDSSGMVIRNPDGSIPQRMVIMDEANWLAPSRYWNTLPKDLLRMWSESRKLGLNVIWTAQHESRVDTALRELTEIVWHSHHIGKMHWYTATLPNETDKQKQTVLGHKRLWRSDELMSSYDTFQHFPITRADLEKALDGKEWRHSAPELAVVNAQIVEPKKKRLWAK